MWPAIALAGLGAIQGQQQADAQRQANKQQADMAAAQTEFSPWTGAGPGKAKLGAVTGSPLAGAVQGGLSGAMYGDKLGFGGGAGGPNEMDMAIEQGQAYGPAKPLSMYK
jgi:hypothetical protein